MPYRRLPNTDIARIKALKTAIKKSANTDFLNIAFSVKNLSEAKKAVLHFESLCNNYQQTLDTQVKANIAFQPKVKNARMYISHFIQVLYMSVTRNEIKSEYLKLYGLEHLNLNLPDLNSNDQILEWGNKIIDGEKERIAQSGVPLYNPGIARVTVMFTQFKEGYQTQKIHQKATARTHAEMSAYRDTIDDIILRIWDEVEAFNIDLPPAKRYEENKAYGLIYYYRKGEVVE